MKRVCYESAGAYCVTTLQNYTAYVQDPKKVVRLSKTAHDNAYDAVIWYCLHSTAKLEDFVPCPY